MNFFFRFFFVVFSALAIDVIIVESMGYVVQDIFNVPETEMLNWIYWGDTFISRILVSIIGTFAGGYVIGSSLNRGINFALIIYLIPILSFWTFGLYGYYYVASLDHNLQNPEFHLFAEKKLIPLITLLLTIPSAFVGSSLGRKRGFNDQTYSVLGVKWYHLLWYVPTCFSFGVAVISMLILTVFYSLWLGENPLSTSFLMIFPNPIVAEGLSIIGIALLLISSIKIFNVIYSILSNKDFEIKFKFIKIIGGTIYFWLLFAITFNFPQIISYEFGLNSIFERIDHIPKNINEWFNLCLVFLSGLVSQQVATQILSKSDLLRPIFIKVSWFKKQIIENLRITRLK